MFTQEKSCAVCLRLSRKQNAHEQRHTVRGCVENAAQIPRTIQPVSIVHLSGLCRISDFCFGTQAEGLDAEADAEVDKVIAEITEGVLEGAVDAPTAVPEPAAVAAPAAAAEEEEKANAMKARLESL